MPAERKTVTETPLWVSAKADSIEMPFRNITLKTSKDLYSVGEDADILVMSPVSDGNMLITLEGNSIIFKRDCRDERKYAPIQSQDSCRRWLRTSRCPAVQFAGNDVYKMPDQDCSRPPKEKFLAVNLTPSKTEYKPGETAEIAIETLDSQNKGISSEVSRCGGR